MKDKNGRTIKPGDTVKDVTFAKRPIPYTVEDRDGKLVLTHDGLIPERANAAFAKKSEWFEKVEPSKEKE